VFAIVVDIAGFAAYTTLSTLIAGLAGIFGVTLPFGFYVASSSVMAVVTSPIFILLLLTGGAVYIDRKQGAKLKERLIPIIIFQLVLTSYIESKETNYDEVIDHYSQKKEEYDKLVEEKRDYENKLNDEKYLLDTYLNKKRDVLKLIKGKEKDLHNIVNHVIEQLEHNDINSIMGGSKFDILRGEYIKIVTELEAIKDADNKSDTATLGKFIKDKYKKGKLIINRQIIESKKKKILNEMSEELLSDQTTSFNEEVTEYNQIMDERNKNRTELEAINKKIEIVQGNIKGIKKNIRRLYDQLESMNNTYFGIADNMEERIIQ
jgi:DNA repair exonuclease SbcCD ATPase subunit